jgi:predicted methyltransferase
MIPLTEQAHAELRAALKPGDVVIDATVGNGHDTLFLATCVGPQGQVFGFDVQPRAIEQTHLRLQAAGLENVSLHQWDHAGMAAVIPQAVHGRVAAVMFNLGYLPGGEKTLVTRTETTLAAVKVAFDLLKPGGLLTVIAYPGHPGGQEETEALTAFFHQLPAIDARVHRIPARENSATAPQLFVVTRLIMA